MKTEREIRAKIREIMKERKYLLTGTIATVFINAPRALEQLATESKLHALHWVIGAEYKSKLRGHD